ncbi:MAG: hypothetical protein KC547_20690, partial [Anaerolineae bacterium]|nr:hypothetical protein [Anaerolineae bacterium]
MDEPREQVKAQRAALRRVEHDRFETVSARGTRHETLNLVIVVYHPSDDAPDLNYVAPRRGTAWVSASALQEGLLRLQALGRTPRFAYLEGLLPPFFRQTLVESGLELVQDDPVFDPADVAQQTKPVGRLVVYGVPEDKTKASVNERLA